MIHELYGGEVEVEEVTHVAGDSTKEGRIGWMEESASSGKRVMV